MSPKEAVVRSVAIVDDEEMIVSSLGGFLRLETDYEVRGYTSPVKALEELRMRPVDLVISDFLMPELNGIEFLREVKELFPDVPCILLTGYADKENAIQGINELGLYQYVEKPWDNASLLMVINNGLNQRSLTQDLRSKLKELDAVTAQRRSLQKDVSEYQEELHLARQAQLESLPDCCPNVPNISLAALYLPALEVGGDYYDFARSADSRSVIMVADVSGHGIQAALGTMMVKGLFHELAPRSDSPAELLSALNDRLVQYLPPTMFVAATLCFVNEDATEIQLANAAGAYPVVIDGSGNIERIMLNGMPLGVFESPSFKIDPARTEALEKDMMLLLHTDGLLDVENESGDQLEWDGLYNVLKEGPRHSAHRFLDAIHEKLNAFRGRADQPDDINIVALREGDPEG